jgi:uncharacterized protein (TIGR03437 family)
MLLRFFGFILLAVACGRATQAAPQVDGVVNAASFGSPLAPGSLAALFGSGLADAVHQGLFDPSRNAFPTAVAGVSVSVNEINAPLTYTSPGQINFQVPWETPVAPAAVAVQVTRDAVASNAQAVTISATSPSAFAVNGVAIVTCFNSAVTAGAVCTLWGNGFGGTNSPQQDGVPASASAPLNALSASGACTLSISGQSAGIQYCGAAPGQVIDQLNFVYPAGVPAGPLPVDATLTIGSASATFQVAAPANAGASYFVAPSGSDASPGTQGQPFATIQAAVNRLKPGDVLYVGGGEYHEAVTVNVSGTAAAPITIQAYPGECPILIGAKPVSGPWTLYSGAIYKTPWPSQPQQVFADGRMLNEARWPNTPIEDFANQVNARADAGTQTSVTYSGLPQVDLTGAWVKIVAGQAWVGYTRQVASHDRVSGTLSFIQPINAMSELIPRRNNLFYVFGKLNLLDSPGEWFWDPVERSLYVWTQDGGPPAGRVEAGTASPVLDLSGQTYVTVKGLSARGGWFNLNNSAYCTVEDFHLWAPTWIRIVDGYALWPEIMYLGGVDVSGAGNLVQRGSVSLSGRSGIHLAGTGNTVREVTVEDQGWNWTNNVAIDLTGADQALVENCTVQRTSAAGMFLTVRSRTLNNLIESTCLFMEDCGNVDSWGTDGQGAEVAYNIFRGNHARWGAGIYLDAGSKNFYVHDNLVQDVLWNGMNVTDINVIENNTFIDAQHQSINFVPPVDQVGADWSAGVVAHNQLANPVPLFVYLGQPISLIPDYGYGAYTTLAPGPRRVELDWTQFAQPGWSQQQVPMDLSQATSISFTIDVPINAFSYSIGGLRLLPAGGSGDAGAVPVAGATWTASCNSGSTCAPTDSGPVSWGIAGISVFNGQNFLTAALPAALTDLRAYRGLAFDLVAESASRTYNFQGYQDVDNGLDAAPGRGARLPASVGANPSSAVATCFAPAPR